ncbi:hypothetical protein LOO41_000597 [Salmonella enterica]|nr:hypothetical protein [Salmonella enterica]EKK8885240.1 hypothetical protein [Salmonella enterica]
MAIINAGPAERRNDLNLYLTASFFALLHMVILSAKCHANQCETFRRATDLLYILYTLSEGEDSVESTACSFYHSSLNE